MLPIVQRELQTAARNSKLYRRRTISGLAVVFIATFIVLFNQFSRHRGGFFEVVASFALILCLVEGVRKTSDSISIEKREGTLGLLFLSTLSGWDIILGKLAGAALRSLSTLLSFVPILAIALLIGGTTIGEFWRIILLLILALLMSLCFCLCLSTFAREGSVVGSLILITAYCLAPFISLIDKKAAKWIVPLSPFASFTNALDAYYSRDYLPYWLGIGYLAAIAFISLFIASFVLPRTWQDRPVKARRDSRLTALSPKLAAKRRAMLDRNPVMWLMFNPRSHGRFKFFLYVVGLLAIIATIIAFYFSEDMGGMEVALFPLAIGFAVVTLVSSVRVARATSRNFAEARANGALELLLSTPLKVQSIVNGQWLAVRADLFPAMVLFVAFAAGTLIFANISGEPEVSLWLLKFLAEAILGFATIAAVGVWMGLTAKTPGRAFFRTIMLGLIAPHFICVPTLVIQLVLLLVALDKISANFRRFVAEQYLATPTLAAISPAPPNTPPVIR